MLSTYITSALAIAMAVTGAPIRINGATKIQQTMWHNGAGITIDGTLTSTGRMATNEYLQISGVAESGTDCSPLGLVGQDGVGEILSCQSGKWRKPRVSTVIRERTNNDYRWPSASISCADNEQVVGGGGTCTQPGGVIWLTHSSPQGNGWFVKCDGGMANEWGTATVFAICA
ncbi:MAG: hypothetical protein J3R72DRAFT_453414, partial [Linnemannia gamsii]